MSQLLKQLQQARQELREERRLLKIAIFLGDGLQHDRHYWRARWHAAQLELNAWRKYGGVLATHGFLPPEPYPDLAEYPEEQ